PLSAVFGGDADYNLIAGLFASLPLYNVADAILALLVVAHAFLSVLSIYYSSVAPASFFSSGNLTYVIGRVSAVAIVPFVAYMMYVTRFSPGAVPSGAADFSSISSVISSRSEFVFFVCGFIAFGAYIACALRLVLFQWGLLAGARSKRFFWIFTSGAGFVVAVWGLLVLFAFRA
ncbi:MAG TPA: hypothetical protein PKW68_02745, partial [bacterium]|nr:hypothetical protein [bacterium]